MASAIEFSLEVIYLISTLIPDNSTYTLAIVLWSGNSCLLRILTKFRLSQYIMVRGSLLYRLNSYLKFLIANNIALASNCSMFCFDSASVHDFPK
jgi:hypothetical protein